ncbi:hypothetical protein CDV36_010041 [Fusarium kuroshium]|uniref:CBM21 domain-containing protein n=2 Tax=Fusarium solani species complex TaxID=232080 RepID=A0A3M2RYJ1_9HYPO|nr:hypothetical protein CDV36_010041 [Fusarium kuroshium]RSL91133.1 hypothetical protein CEP51_000371 [Fusarium floridanum]
MNRVSTSSTSCYALTLDYPLRPGSPSLKHYRLPSSHSRQANYAQPLHNTTAGILTLTGLGAEPSIMVTGSSGMRVRSPALVEYRERDDAGNGNENKTAPEDLEKQPKESPEVAKVSNQDSRGESPPPCAPTKKTSPGIGSLDDRGKVGNGLPSCQETDTTTQGPGYRLQRPRSESSERVRPALRPRHHRSSSMPSFSKTVHFDTKLNNVCYFRKADRPLAVSAGSSPVIGHLEVNEYPFYADNDEDLFEWQLFTPNFPRDSLDRDSMPARLERLYLSHDKKHILGSVIVANLAFEKSVICRFTLDYWTTTSETTAVHCCAVPGQMGKYDRFIFSIRLTETVNIESKPIFLCIRYNVNGQEFWDNNLGTNFQDMIQNIEHFKNITLVEHVLT